jgi:hypothetical protein
MRQQGLQILLSRSCKHLRHQIAAPELRLRCLVSAETHQDCGELLRRLLIDHRHEGPGHLNRGELHAQEHRAPVLVKASHKPYVLCADGPVCVAPIGPKLGVIRLSSSLNPDLRIDRLRFRESFKLGLLAGSAEDGWGLEGTVDPFFMLY